MSADIQRDLDRLEKWANRNIMMLKNRKCQVLYLGRNNLPHKHRLRSDQLERSFDKKCLEVLESEYEPATCPCSKGKQPPALGRMLSPSGAMSSFLSAQCW